MVDTNIPISLVKSNTITTLLKHDVVEQFQYVINFDIVQNLEHK